MPQISVAERSAQASAGPGSGPNVLSYSSPADVVTDPFPFIVVRDAMDPELCARLLAGYPPVEVIRGGNLSESRAYEQPGDEGNQRFSYTAKMALENPEVDPAWKDMLERHVSPRFLEDVVRVFGPAIRELHPDFERRFGRLEELRPGVRHYVDPRKVDVTLEAQICVNTPVRERPSSVREAHVDLPDKLFVGLFYLRRPEDDSTGGGLEIYRSARPEGVRLDGQYARLEDVEVAHRVAYESNVFVGFVNSKRSLHGVAVREVTEHPRLFMNLGIEVERSIFELPGYQTPGWRLRETGLKRRWHDVTRRLRRLGGLGLR